MDLGSLPQPPAPKDQGCHRRGSPPQASAQDCDSLGSIAQAAFSMALGTAFWAPSHPLGPTGQRKKCEPLSAFLRRRGKFMALSSAKAKPWPSQGTIMVHPKSAHFLPLCPWCWESSWFYAAPES